MLKKTTFMLLTVLLVAIPAAHAQTAGGIGNGTVDDRLEDLPGDVDFADLRALLERVDRSLVGVLLTTGEIDLDLALRFAAIFSEGEIDDRRLAALQELLEDLAEQNGGLAGELEALISDLLAGGAGDGGEDDELQPFLEELLAAVAELDEGLAQRFAAFLDEGGEDAQLERLLDNLADLDEHLADELAAALGAVGDGEEPPAEQPEEVDLELALERLLEAAEELDPALTDNLLAAIEAGDVDDLERLLEALAAADRELSGQLGRVLASLGFRDRPDGNDEPDVDDRFDLGQVVRNAQVWFDSDLAMDLNGDRSIDEIDFREFLQRLDELPDGAHPLRIIRTVPEWLSSRHAADLNGNGSTDAADLRLFLQRLDGLLDELPDDVDFAELEALLERVDRSLVGLLLTVADVDLDLALRFAVLLSAGEIGDRRLAALEDLLALLANEHDGLAAELEAVIFDLVAAGEVPEDGPDEVDLEELLERLLSAVGDLDADLAEAFFVALEEGEVEELRRLLDALDALDGDLAARLGRVLAALSEEEDIDEAEDRFDLGDIVRVFRVWAASDFAADFNGDGATDPADFREFLQRLDTLPDGVHPLQVLRTLREWLSSPLAEDLNGDGVTDAADFRQFAERLAELADELPDGVDPGDVAEGLRDWLASDLAADFNGDGTIDAADFREFVRRLDELPDDVDPIRVLRTAREWLSSPLAIDLNGDGAVDAADFRRFLEELNERLDDGLDDLEEEDLEALLGALLAAVEELDPGLAERLFAFLDEENFDEDGLERLGNLLEALAELDRDLAGQLRELLAELIDLEDLGDEEIDEEEIDRRFNRWAASDAAEDFNDNGELDFEDFVIFLEEFAEEGGLLRFDGVLEGIDFAEGLIFIDGDVYDPADELVIEDNNGRELGLAQLRRILGRALKVAVLLNEDDEVLRLVILSRIDNVLPEEPVPATQEFFGAVAAIDGRNIVLAGPRFDLTSRTRVAGPNNQALNLGDLEAGQLLSIVPGPPDAANGGVEPTALRIQVANPRNPPSPGADRVVGILIGAAGPDSDDPHIQLAGPVASFNAETRFGDIDGNSLGAGDVDIDDFVRMEVRQSGFGEDNPVALEVLVLEGAQEPPPPSDDGNVDRIEVEGLVLDVDPQGRFLALEGDRIRLGANALVRLIDGARAAPADLFIGDLLEIDTQPDGRGGFVATRLQVIDPALQVFDRPGVLVGSFEGIDAGELVLAGPFFKVPRDAEIRGLGGRLIELEQLEAGALVRVVASAPRFRLGETLPVALGIRVIRPLEIDPVDPVRPGVQRVVRSFPADGDVGIPLQTRVEVTFRQPVRDALFDPAFEFEIFPPPLKFSDLDISVDGRTLSAEVLLEENRVYQLAVITSEIGLYSASFTPAEELSVGTLAGTVVAPAELPEDVRFLPGESFVLLIEDFSDEALFDEGFDEEEDLFDLIEEHIVAGIPLEGRQFRFANVAAGDYFVVAFVGFDIGRGEVIELQAFLDGDGDGEPDLVTVEEGQETVVELALQLPEPLRVVSLTPEPRSANVEEEAEIAITFNRPAFLEEEDVFIFPEPLEFIGFEPNDDFTEYVLRVELEDDTIYRVSVEFAEDEEGGELVEGARTIFTTGDDFGQTHTVSGRLIVPHLPTAHRFDGPAFVGLIPFGDIDPEDFDIGSFDEEDIVAFTTTRQAEYVIEDVRPGVYAAVAFALVDVPRGFRPPDPLERALENFRIDESRFAAQVLEVFDTIELFGFHGQQQPARVVEDQQGVDIPMRASGLTRQEVMRVTRVGFPDVNLGPVSSRDALPVVGADQTEIGVQFNKRLRFGRGFAAIEAALNGRPLRDFRIENDGREIFFRVALEEDRVYKFSVFDAEAQDGSVLQQPLDVAFSTGAAQVALGAVSGSVRLGTVDADGVELTGDLADQIDAAKVVLFEVDANAPDALVRAGVGRVKRDGTYLIDGVEPGAYRAFAEIQSSSGQEVRGVYDGDGDGTADVFRVLADQVTAEVNIQARVVVETSEDETPVKTTPPGGNENAVLTVDLDPAAGDQGQTNLSGVEVGQRVTVDVHIDGATDLSGVALKLRYDADILTFIEASDAVDGRTNFLRQNGALALYLFPLLREPELEYGGAILGATELTAVDGGGFLARFEFEVSEQFEGAQVILEEATLNSLAGQDVVQPNQSAKLAPPVFVEQVKGPVSFDFDTATGDQEVFHKGFIKPGDVFEVDFYINFDKIGDGLKDLANYSVTVEYDANQLDFVSYAPATEEEANILIAAGGVVPTLPAITSTGKVTFGNAVLAPDPSIVATASGLIGRLSFVAKDGFTQTDLLITSYAYKSIEAPQQDITTLIFARVATDEIEFSTPVAGGGDGSGGDGGAAVAAVDFDGSGGVDFNDFFAFADKFGVSVEVDATVAVFDVDKSGVVDFGDFFAFADKFGQSVAGKVLPRQAVFAPVEGQLALAPVAVEDGLEVQLVGHDLATGGFRAVLTYDEAAFRFDGVTLAGGVLDGQRPGLVLTQEQPGQVLLLGSGTGGTAGEGLLARLRFVPLSREAVGVFDLVEGQVRRGLTLVQPSLGGAVEGRFVPQVYALLANYPNPFNPSTTIGYQLPVAGPVRLELYDVLGQKIRTLVSGPVAAGVHRAVWDGRDQSGHQVAGGVYFYRLQAGDFHQVRKLLLLK